METCETTYANDSAKVVCLRCRWVGLNADCRTKTVYSSRFRLEGLPIQICPDCGSDQVALLGPEKKRKVKVR